MTKTDYWDLGIGDMFRYRDDQHDFIKINPIQCVSLSFYHHRLKISPVPHELLTDMWRPYGKEEEEELSLKGR